MTDDQPWEGDVNETVVAEWTAETAPFERVKDVLMSTTTYQYAREIGERARVSEPSARTHLESLAAAGFADTDESGRGKQYKRARETVAMGRITEIHDALTKAELVEGIRDLKASIESIQERYDATDPDDLALELDAADGEGWADLSRWRSLEENLKIAQAALSLYEFDPDSDRGDAVRPDETNTDRGAFARDSGDLSA